MCSASSFIIAGDFFFPVCCVVLCFLLIIIIFWIDLLNFDKYHRNRWTLYLDGPLISVIAITIHLIHPETLHSKVFC